jgi:hypothetical protein
MSSLVYNRTGPTIFITANVTPGTANITGVNTIKIDNASNGNVDIFFNYGTSNTTTATIATATSTGTGICIQHGATEFIQLAAPFGNPQQIFMAAAAASAVGVYVTPVAIVNSGN